ncbi:MAG: hypothetical protein IPJ77_07205 [Planctomycetes bacterium]|nr:hypothetical protein [Planctomycetota bacterium]
MQKSFSLATALVASTFAPLALAQVQGPSSSQAPYVLPVASGVQTVSILTVGDTVTSGGTSYRLVGLPDGLGAYRTHGNSFTLLANHEIVGTAGVVRAHGQTGAFVSKWRIRRNDLSVLQGEDLIETVNNVTGTAQMSRLCSGDLPSQRAFFPLPGHHGPLPQIFFSGEETGAEGRAFAHVATGALEGQSFELPALGKMSFENVLVRPFPGFRTVVAATDDTTPGQVYFYLGTKRWSGNLIDRLGLTGGALYGVRVPGVALEDRATGIGAATRFELANLGDVSAKTGAQLQSDSVAASVTEFLRPEDGVWDPCDPRVFYFVTTDRFQSSTQDGRSRLWMLRFDSAFAPQNGGTITALLDGTEGQ